MQSKASRMRAIVKQDNARRAARIIMEDAMLGLDMIEDALSDASKIAANRTKGAFVNPCLVRGIGTVNPPMPTAASRNSWDAFDSPRRGVATGTELTNNGIPTVLVIKPGQPDAVVPVSAFKGQRNQRMGIRRQSVAHTPEVARLAPIQNYSE